jgi:hypothetical protein
VNYVLDIELKLAPESSEYRTKLSPHQTLSAPNSLRTKLSQWASPKLLGER